MEGCVQLIDSWIKEIVDNLKDPSTLVDLNLGEKTLNYVLIDRDLYKIRINSVLLKCVGKTEFFKFMVKVMMDFVVPTWLVL